MSITAYVGLPGSGKSYATVEHQILPALNAGRHVVTNVPVNVDLLRQDIKGGTLDEFPLEQVLADPERIFDYALPGCVLVLDELWKIFPAGVKANAAPEPFKRLLAEHRHMVDGAGNSMQIVFVTQDLSQVSAFARALVEQTFHITKLSSMGFSKRYRVDVYHGPVTGAHPSVGKRQREMYGRYRKEVYRYYNSHTMSQAGEAGANEKTVDRRGVVWKSPFFWLGIPAFVILAGWGIHHVWSFFHPDKKPAPAPAVGGRPAQVSQASVNPFDRLKGAPPPALAKVSGYIEVGGAPDASLVILTDGPRSWLIRFSDGCSFQRRRSIKCVWDGKTYSAVGAAFIPPELKP